MIKLIRSFTYSPPISIIRRLCSILLLWFFALWLYDLGHVIVLKLMIVLIVVKLHLILVNLLLWLLLKVVNEFAESVIFCLKSLDVLHSLLDLRFSKYQYQSLTIRTYKCLMLSSCFFLSCFAYLFCFDSSSILDSVFSIVVQVVHTKSSIVSISMFILSSKFCFSVSMFASFYLMS